MLLLFICLFYFHHKLKKFKIPRPTRVELRTDFPLKRCHSPVRRFLFSSQQLHHCVHAGNWSLFLEVRFCPHFFMFQGKHCSRISFFPSVLLNFKTVFVWFFFSRTVSVELQVLVPSPQRWFISVLLLCFRFLESVYASGSKSCLWLCLIFLLLLQFTSFSVEFQNSTRIFQELWFECQDPKDHHHLCCFC